MPRASDVPTLKRPYGTDRVSEGPDGLIYLSSRFEKGWTPRREKELRRAAFPGTCVRWDEELFEVVSIEVLPAGVRYGLRRWEESSAIRVCQPYDKDSEARRATDRREASRRTHTRRVSMALALLVGHLPGHVQQRLQNEYGAPAATLTIISLAPLFVVGVASLVFLPATLLGAPLGIPIPLLMLGMYFFLESGIRFSVAFVQGQPIGSAAGTAVWFIWSLFKSRNRTGQSRNY